jgi:hypothetical protein
MEAWEQHEGEPEDSYIRFLYYRNLGPTRSLDAAYLLYVQSGEIETKEKGVVLVTKRNKPSRASGQWREDASTYSWEFRANQWDINNLSIAGKSVISDFYEMLSLMTFQTLETIREGKLKPTSYSQILEGMALIGSIVSPEAIAAWRDSASTDRQKLATPDQTGHEDNNISSIDAKRKRA